MVPVEDFQAAATTEGGGKQKLMPCPRHLPTPLDMFCKDCLVALCSSCLRETHAGHRITTLQKAAHKERARVAGLCEAAEADIDRRTAKDASARLRLSEFEEEIRSMHDEIEDSAAALAARVEEHRRRAHEELEGDTAATVQRLRRLLEEAEEELERARRSHARALGCVREGSDAEVLGRAEDMARELSALSEAAAAAARAEDGPLGACRCQRVYGPSARQHRGWRRRQQSKQQMGDGCYR